MMDRKILLPDPYPDENCYSILCRYAVRSECASDNRLSTVLYGNTMPLAGLLYKPLRSIDLERWTGKEGWNILYGEDHSCLQYFAVFVGYDDFQLLRQCRTGLMLSGGQTKRISRKCGLTKIRKKHMWYCPACVAEDFQAYGETYWRRLHQMPGVSYCVQHKVRLRESGLPVSEMNYRLYPASYALLHIPDKGVDHQGNIFEEEFLQVTEDTRWLLKTGFQLTDNDSLRRMFAETAGRELNEHTVYPVGIDKNIRFENYLAARVLKESGRKTVGPEIQKYLSTITSIDRIFGSFESFWETGG